MAESAVRSGDSADDARGDGRLGPPRKSPENQHSVTMRELGKLTAEQVGHISQPVPVTSNGLPAAWLVPLSSGVCRRAELVTAGRLVPGRPEGLSGWSPLPASEDGQSLSEVLVNMRQKER